MRAGRAMGVALAVLGLPRWPGELAPRPAAAAPQAVDRHRAWSTEVGRAVIVRKLQGGGPPVVTCLPRQGRPAARHEHVLQGEPAWTALAGDGPRLGVEIRDVTADDVTTLKLRARRASSSTW